jgi:hypothetical protein
MNQLLPFEEVPPPAEMNFDARVEAIAVEIDMVRGTVTLRVAGLVAEAHELFLYNRDEGGFQGWVERRLRMSTSTAYKLLDVHKRFGGESLHIVETLSRSVLYLIAPESVPDEARAEVIERAEAGEKLTHAQVKAIVAKAVAEAREAERPAVEAQLAQLRQDAERREAAVRAEYAGKMFIEPAELEAEIAKAMQPLQRQAADLQKKLDDMKERERKRVENERKRRAEDADPLERRKKQQKAPIDDALSLSATAVKRGLIDLTETMTKIAPADFIKVSTQSADATEQTLAQWLSDSPHRARTAISWLTNFVEQFEGRQ